MKLLPKKIMLFLFLLIAITNTNGQKSISFTSGELKYFDNLKLSLDRASVEIYINDEIFKYKASEIDFINIDSKEKYVSKNVKIKSKKAYYLLRLIEEGQVDFYAYQENIFFIQGENKPLEKLYYTRKDVSTSRIDTMYFTLQEEGSFYVTKQYLTIIQDHLGPSYTVSKNLRLKERSIKKAVQSLNSNFPLVESSSYFNPLVFKRFYIGGLAIRKKDTDKILIAPQISYELGTNLTGAMTTGYLSYTFLSSINEDGKSSIFQNFQQGISFGIRQYFLKNKIINPFVDFGIQNESMTLQSGLIITKSDFIFSGSINLKNNLLGTSSTSSNLFQLNLGYKI